jgi:hypothetical protein
MMFFLDKITDGGKRLDEAKAEMDKIDNHYVYKCCHNYIYNSKGEVLSDTGAVPPDKEVSKLRYNCGGDWKNYENYTSALTNIRDLNLNWRH